MASARFHITYSRIMHRFVAVTLVLWVLWAILGSELVLMEMK